MNINGIKKKHKSISKLVFKNIPKFTVITGVNGAGKSQFLEMLYYNFYQSKGRSAGGNSLQTLLKDCFDYEGEQLGFDDIIYSQSLFSLGGNSEIDQSNIQNSANSIWQWLVKDNPKHNPNRQNRNTNFPNFLTDYGLEEIKSQLREKNLDPEDLTFPQFADSVNFDFMVYGRMNLDFELSHLFMSYKYMYKDLRIDEDMSDEEVIKEIGPKPWEILNNLLTEMKFEYQFETPAKTKTISKYKLQMINSSGDRFNVSDLSSGEKVILRLLTWLFTSNNYQKHCKLFILDEPDAHLHPSQTKMLIDVISETLVKKFDVRVIMTTHSPSTVALTPQENLFFMKKSDVEDRIVPAVKDEAIKALLCGVRSISIEPENIIQVFTESQADQFFYKKMQLYLSDRLDNNIVMNFISSGVNDGDVELVKSTVNKLNSAGNKKVFGVIDWDSKNRTEGQVIVPGNGQRYTLESYVFDPLVIASYLIDKLELPNSLEKYKAVNHTLLHELEVQDLQELSSGVEAFLFGGEEQFEQRKQCSSKRYNGVDVSVSDYFCTKCGEELLMKLHEKIPSLKRYNSKYKLVEEITNTYLRHCYKLLPKEIEDVFLQIQSMV